MSLFNYCNKPFMWNEKRQLYRKLDKMNLEELLKLKSSLHFLDNDYSDIMQYLFYRGVAEWKENEYTGPVMGGTPTGQYVWKEFTKCITDYKEKADHFDCWQEDNPNEGQGSSIIFELPSWNKANAK